MEEEKDGGGRRRQPVGDSQSWGSPASARVNTKPLNGMKSRDESQCPGVAALEVWHGALRTQEPWAPGEQPGPEEGRASLGRVLCTLWLSEPASRAAHTGQGVCATSGVLG